MRTFYTEEFSNPPNVAQQEGGQTHWVMGTGHLSHPFYDLWGPVLHILASLILLTSLLPEDGGKNN